MNYFNAIIEKLNEIREIVEKQPVGTYIYRGEAEHYETISSNLYRFCRDENLPIMYPAGIKSLLQNSLRKFKRFADEEEELEYADMIQHYGGLTDRIDFTSDYLIALFFACHGSSNKNGRIIMLHQDKAGIVMKKGYCKIRSLDASNNRFITQKSVFVIPSEGYIDIEQDGVIAVNIPKNIKRAILLFLRKHHGISIETIYGDFSRVIRLQSDYLKATSYYLHGNDYLLKNQYDLAIQKFDEAIKLDSNHAESYQGRGIAYAYKDEDGLAIENFSEAVEMSQYNAKFYLSRGNVYAKIGKYEKAIADFEKADFNLIPRDDIVLPQILLSLGNFHAKRENYNEAVKIFDHAIRILPDFRGRFGWHPSQETYYTAAALHNSLGNIYAKIGKDNRAIACFEESIKLEKHNLCPYLNLSTVYMEVNEQGKALECYNRLAKTMFKSNFIVYLCRGHFYAKINKYKKAIDDFSEAIKYLKIRWYRSLIFFYRGHFYAKIGNLKNAVDNFNEAGKLQQDHHKWIVTAFYNRRNAYLEMGDTQKAAEDFKEAKELDPGLTEDSPPRFLFSTTTVVNEPDIYLTPTLHDWEIDLSP